jgi:hypothetical protein
MSADLTTPERLASIETKLDLLLKSDVDKELRVRAIERKLYSATGGLALLIFFKDPIMRLVFHLP